MKNVWGIGLASAWLMWAQMPATSPDQVEQAIEARRGIAEQTQAAAAFGSVDSPPARPTGQSISLAQLQHRVPKEARKTFDRAKKLSKAGNHEQAAKELERAAADDPEFAAAWGELGGEYGSLKRWAEAERVLRRSLSLDANLWTVHYNLAVVQFQLGDISGAQQSARTALDYAPNDARVHLLLGLLLYQNFKTRDEGMAHLKNAAHTLKQARSLVRAMRAP